MKKRIQWESLLIIAIAIWLSLSYVFMWKPVCWPVGAAYNACINHLRVVESGKEQWALENAGASGDPVTDQDLEPYIRGEHFTCPNSEKSYTINPIGVNATCPNIGAPEPWIKKKRVGLFRWQFIGTCSELRP